MKRMQLLTLAALAFLTLARCTDEQGPTDATPPPNQTTVHDTVAIHNPPPPGGNLVGIWEDQYENKLSGASGFYHRIGRVFVPTEIRVDGSRVWVQAIGNGYKVTFNGTMSGSTLAGWSEWRYSGSGEFMFHIETIYSRKE